MGYKHLFDSLLWIIVSFFVGHKSEIYTLTLADDRIKSNYFWFGLFSSLVASAIFLYYVVWCKNVDVEDWEVHNPYLIPLATIASILCGICFTNAYYGVYGWKTIPMMFTFFMGFASTVSLLPPYSETVTAKSEKMD